MTKILFIYQMKLVLVSLFGRFMAVLVCGRFGLWLCLWPFWMYAAITASATSAGFWLGGQCLLAA